MPETSTTPDATQRGAIRRFAARNKDGLVMELIGGVILALVVSLAIFVLDEVSTERRDAQAEALSNSLFVRQATMAGPEVLPFSGLYLRGAQLSGLPLAGADFSDADLRETELKGTDLSGASLSEADLAGADLSGAILTGADLSEARLDGANLSRADLTGADLAEVDLSAAYFVRGEEPVGLEAVDDLGVVDDTDED